jgi:cell division transport system permease protein
MKPSPFSDEKFASDLDEFSGERAANLIPNARVSGPIPWVIAIMIALTVMAAAGAMAVSNLAARANADLSGAVTVQIVEANPDTRRQSAERAAALLGEDAAVQSIRLVPQEELNAMLEPWLGQMAEGEAVPIPALIDVELNEAASEAEIARLQGVLDLSVPGARVDAQSSWLQPVYSALASLQYLALVLIILLAITSAAAVWLAARSAFTTHRETIEIVHHLGGTDQQIARVFQKTVGIDAAIGSGLGLILGMLGVYFIGSQFSALESGMIDGGGLAFWQWILIILIPLFGVGMAVLTARFTVIRALERML